MSEAVIYSRSEIAVGHNVRLKWLNYSKMKATWGGQHSFDGSKVSSQLTRVPTSMIRCSGLLTHLWGGSTTAQLLFR